MCLSAVIFTSYMIYPFIDILDWKKFSIILDEEDVNRLKDTLKGIREADFTVMQNNLREVSFLTLFYMQNNTL
jgi:hypothetical protein